MKKMILGGVLLCSLSMMAQQQPATAGLRAFMQPETYQGSTIQYGNNPQAGHYAQADDARIYYEVYGTGTPVVVLHGGAWAALTSLRSE